MPNQLEALQKLSNLVIQGIDVDQAKLFSIAHANISSKTILILFNQPTFEVVLEKAIADSRDQRWNSDYVKTIRRNLMLGFISHFNKHLPGQASIELDADLAFDTEGLINQACNIHEHYRHNRANPAQLLVKIPATWEGINAAQDLRRKNINTHLTMVYSFIQAQAGADAEASVMSIPVGPASNWYQANEPQDYSANDPGVATLSHIHTNLKYLGYKTLIRGTDFNSIQQIQLLAGCDQLELTTQLAQKLQQEHQPLEPRLEKPTDTYERPPVTSEKDFRWHLTMNAMAHEKIAQDIRELDMAQYQLDNLIKEKIEAL